MLDDLDAVDWQSVTDAYGPAVRVPGMLRALASSDPEVRTSALEDLTNHIWHQTSLYEATVRAVPFLVELLTDEQVEDKHVLMALLWGIAGAGSHSVYPPYSDQKLQAPPTNDLARRIHAAAREGIPVYLPFLEAQRVALRASAVGVLSLFGEDAAVLAPRIRGAIEREAEPPVRAEMLEALGYLLATGKEHLEGSRTDYISFYSGYLDPSQAAEVQFAAAKAIIPLAGPETPQDAVDLLLDAISRPEVYSRFFTPLAVPGEAARALAHLGEDRGVEALIEGLKRSSGYQAAHEIIEHLLDLAFKGKQIRNQSRTYRTARDGTREIWYSTRSNFSRDNREISVTIPQPVSIVPVTRLSDRQREAVMAVVDAEVAWSYRTNLYGLYGLPNERTALRRLA